jgi:hypothetical protein
MNKRHTPKVVFDTLVRRWQLETADRVLAGERMDDNLAQAAVDKQVAWRSYCDSEELILGDELSREIQWTLEGMDFARFRAVTFNFKEFPKIATTLRGVDPEDLIPIRMNYPLRKMEAKQYRALFLMFSVAELYLWMSALWDRMGQFLNLFAFGVRNVAKNREVWEAIFDKFRDNYGHVEALSKNADLKSLAEMHQQVYPKISHRRNILAHKGSLVGRARARGESDPVAKRVLDRFIVGRDDWDFDKMISENEELCGTCFAASRELFAFVGDFLAWRRETKLRATS